APAGVEPATRSLWGSCSSSLSYGARGRGAATCPSIMTVRVVPGQRGDIRGNAVTGADLWRHAFIRSCVGPSHVLSSATRGSGSAVSPPHRLGMHRRAGELPPAGGPR